MSSHVIYLACSVAGCGTAETLYTGQMSAYEFDDDMWEGETIAIPCKKHTMKRDGQ